MTVHKLGIDVLTNSKRFLIRRLARLKSTMSVQDGGEYAENRGYSQIHIETTKTEAELDDWLYRIKGDFDYVGVFERN